MPIRILLTEDQQMVREGLRSLIHTQPDLKVVAEADDGRAAMRLAMELLPERLRDHELYKQMPVFFIGAQDGDDGVRRVQ